MVFAQEATYIDTLLSWDWKLPTTQLHVLHFERTIPPLSM